VNTGPLKPLAVIVRELGSSRSRTSPENGGVAKPRPSIVASFCCQWATAGR